MIRSIGQQFLHISTTTTVKPEVDTLVRDHQRLVKEIEELQKLVYLDHLTGVGNRRKYDTELERCLQMKHRYQTESSLVLVDLDEFKQINDKFGHPTGDKVLVDIANLLVAQSRSTDIVCRLGGDEFAIIMPGVTCGQARLASQRLHKAIRHYAESQDIPISASFGVTAIGNGKDQTYQRADEVLYQAKTQGKDQVVCEVRMR